MSFERKNVKLFNKEGKIIEYKHITTTGSVLYSDEPIQNSLQRRKKANNIVYIYKEKGKTKSKGLKKYTREFLLSIRSKVDITKNPNINKKCTSLLRNSKKDDMFKEFNSTGFCFTNYEKFLTITSNCLFCGHSCPIAPLSSPANNYNQSKEELKNLSCCITCLGLIEKKFIKTNTITVGESYPITTFTYIPKTYLEKQFIINLFDIKNKDIEIVIKKILYKLINNVFNNV